MNKFEKKLLKNFIEKFVNTYDDYDQLEILVLSFGLTYEEIEKYGFEFDEDVLKRFKGDNNE